MKIAHSGRGSIYIYHNDHNPPHFHVYVEELECRYTIEDCSPLEGDRLDGKREKRLREWWSTYKPQLDENWLRTQRQPMPRLITLPPPKW